MRDPPPSAAITARTSEGSTLAERPSFVFRRIYFGSIIHRYHVQVRQVRPPLAAATRRNRQPRVRIHFSMEHRGATYHVTFDGAAWRWTVLIGDRTFTGTETLRGVAMYRAVKAIQLDEERDRKRQERARKKNDDAE